jgi:hypothetical protein
MAIHGTSYKVLGLGHWIEDFRLAPYVELALHVHDYGHVSDCENDHENGDGLVGQQRNQG